MKVYIFSFHRHGVTLSQHSDEDTARNEEVDKDLTENDSNGVTGVVPGIDTKKKQGGSASTIYRINKTDSFGCRRCKEKGDKWHMSERRRRQSIK